MSACVISLLVLFCNSYADYYSILEFKQYNYTVLVFDGNDCDPQHEAALPVSIERVDSSRCCYEFGRRRNLYDSDSHCSPRAVTLESEPADETEQKPRRAKRSIEGAKVSIFDWIGKIGLGIFVSGGTFVSIYSWRRYKSRLAIRFPNLDLELGGRQSLNPGNGQARRLISMPADFWSIDDMTTHQLIVEAYYHNELIRPAMNARTVTNLKRRLRELRRTARAPEIEPQVEDQDAQEPVDQLEGASGVGGVDNSAQRYDFDCF